MKVKTLQYSVDNICLIQTYKEFCVFPTKSQWAFLEMGSSKNCAWETFHKQKTITTFMKG